MAKLNLLDLYKMYPRKLGKSAGLSRLRQQIKTKEDYELFKIAVKNYVELIKRDCTEAKYVKYFSTFVGHNNEQPWRDYADSDIGECDIGSSIWDGLKDE